MVSTNGLKKSVAEANSALRKRERAQDRLVALSREIVRSCAVAIKSLHGKERKAAEAGARDAGALVAQARKADKGLEHVAMQAYQEYAEVRALLAAVSGEEIPSARELRIPFEAYISGLMDCVGELRREMLEELKRGDRRAASARFEAMNAIYEEALPLRFSNSILPGFRKKQDVARIQLDNARSELLRG